MPKFLTRNLKIEHVLNNTPLKSWDRNQLALFESYRREPSRHVTVPNTAHNTLGRWKSNGSNLAGLKLAPAIPASMPNTSAYRIGSTELLTLVLMLVLMLFLFIINSWLLMFRHGDAYKAVSKPPFRLADRLAGHTAPIIQALCGR